MQENSLSIILLFVSSREQCPIDVSMGMLSPFWLKHTFLIYSSIPLSSCCAVYCYSNCRSHGDHCYLLSIRWVLTHLISYPATIMLFSFLPYHSCLWLPDGVLTVDVVSVSCFQPIMLITVLLFILPSVVMSICTSDLDCHVHAKCSITSGTCYGLGGRGDWCDHDFDCSENLSCLVNHCLKTWQLMTIYALIGIAGLILLSCLIMICCCLCRNRKRRRKGKKGSKKMRIEYQRAPDSPIVKSAGVRIAPLASIDEGCEEPPPPTMMLPVDREIVRGKERKSSYDRVIKEYIESFSLRREAQRQQDVEIEESYN